MFKFDIPWSKMPKTLIESLEFEKVPTAYFRKLVIHIFIDELMKVCMQIPCCLMFFVICVAFKIMAVVMILQLQSQG